MITGVPQAMRAITFTLTVLFAVAVAVTEVAHPYTAAAQARDGELRVATFNIHKGADGDDHYDLQRTIEAIASFNADLVALQEVMRNKTQFNCDDQATLIAEGLTRLTQRKWTFTYVKSWIFDNRECVQSGRGNDVETEGVVLFSPQQMVSTNAIRLAESRVGVAARVASMPDVPVVTTHLAAGRRQQANRLLQIGALMPWMDAERAGIFMGDMNSRPEAPELVPLMARYRDAWLEGMERGVASGGPTCCVVGEAARTRFDYIFYDPTGPLALESIDVRSTATATHGEVSDHLPVIATFRRTPSRASVLQSSSAAR